MGRRNETNRLEHKKQVDNKKKRKLEAELLRKEKLKAIHAQYKQAKSE